MTTNQYDNLMERAQPVFVCIWTPPEYQPTTEMHAIGFFSDENGYTAYDRMCIDNLTVNQLYMLSSPIGQFHSVLRIS